MQQQVPVVQYPDMDVPEHVGIVVEEEVNDGLKFEASMASVWKSVNETWSL